jgi:ribosomal protein S12 methylthiotransferase accessory factor
VSNSERVDGAASALRAKLTPQLAHFGITRVADLTDLDRVGIPVFGAVRPASKNLAVSQGKGLSEDSAWVGAVMEALELRAAEAPATRDDADVRALGVATWTFDAPEAAATAAGHARWVLAREWWTDEAVAVPARAVDLDLSRRLSARAPRRSSNALAAHATRTNAVRHALMEAVERHVLAGVAGRRREVQQLDDAPPASGALHTLLERLRRHGLQPRLWRFPTFGGIETVKARLASAQPHAPPVYGAGSDTTLETAALKAVLECLQSRITRLAGARDDLADADYAPAPESALGDPRRGLNATVPWPRGGGCTPAQGVQAVAERIRDAGIERLFVVDLPSPSPDVRIVKVLAPGLGNIFADREHRAA